MKLLNFNRTVMAAALYRLWEGDPFKWLTSVATLMGTLGVSRETGENLQKHLANKIIVKVEEVGGEVVELFDLPEDALEEIEDSLSATQTEEWIDTQIDEQMDNTEATSGVITSVKVVRKYNPHEITQTRGRHTRKTGPCEWCKDREGEYVGQAWVDVPRRVFSKHARCRCTVETWKTVDGETIKETPRGWD